MTLPFWSHLSLLHRINLPEKLPQQNSLASSSVFPRPSIWLSIAILNHHCKVMDSQKTCIELQIPWIHDGLWCQWPNQTEGSCMGCILEVGNDLEKSINLYLHQNQSFQHQLCDSTSLWMWIFCYIQRHGKQEQCICYILRQDHAEHQATWLCEQRKDLSLDEQPTTITTVRQRQLRFLAHILRMPEEEPCRRYALYVPTHGRRRTERRGQATYPEAFWGCRQWSEPRCNCLISCRSLCLENICSRLFRSRMNEWMNEMFVTRNVFTLEQVFLSISRHISDMVRCGKDHKITYFFHCTCKLLHMTVCFICSKTIWLEKIGQRSPIICITMTVNLDL